MERESGSTKPVVLLLAALFVFLMGFVLYADSLGYDFVWDDYDLIVDNPMVRTLDARTVVRIFTEDFWQVTGPAGGYYRPVVALSYHIDYALNGGGAGAARRASGSLYLSMEKYEQAAGQFERLLEIDPEHGVALNNLTAAYARQGRFAEALVPAQRALRLSPSDPMRINNLGSLYMDLKRYDEAAEQFEKSLRLAPEMPNAHFNLGLIRIEQGNAASARAHFEQAAQAGAGFQLAYFYLAVIDHAASNEDSARRWAPRFLQGYPKDDRFREQASVIAEGGE